MADFVWNQDAANNVQNRISEAMRSQSGNMHDRAKSLLQYASRLEEQANRIAAMPPATKVISVRNESPNDEGEYEYNEKTVTDHNEMARRAQEIAEIRAAVQELRSAAREISEEAYTLDSKRRESEALFNELHRLTVACDGRYAARISEIKSQIVYYTQRMLDLKDSIGMFCPQGGRYSSVASALATSPTFAAHWNWVNQTLNKPAEDITQGEFGKLAWWLAKQNDIAGQERFLNYLADKMIVPELHRPLSAPAAFGMQGMSAFTICPQKVLGISMQMELAIAMALETQFELIRQGVGTQDPAFLAVNDHMHTFMQRAALLSVAAELAEVTSQYWEFHSRFGYDRTRRVLIALEGSDGPFSLRQLEGLTGGELVSRGTGLSVNHGSARIGTDYYLGGPTVVDLQELSGQGFIGREMVWIGNVMQRSNAQLSVFSGEYLHHRHQFHMGSFVLSSAANVARFAAVASGVAAAKKVGAIAVADMLPFFDLGMNIRTNLHVARERAEGFQQDIASMVDRATAESFHNTF